MRYYLFLDNNFKSVRIMNNFLEDLKKYFESNPQSKILEDWAKTEEFDQEGGVLIDDFLENYIECRIEAKVSNNIISTYNPSFNSGFFI